MSRKKNSDKIGKRVRFRLDRGRWVYGVCLDVEKTKGRDHSHVEVEGVSSPAWVATRDLEAIAA